MPTSLRSTLLEPLRQRRWVRPALRALAALLGLWLLAWLAVPPLLKAQVERLASEKLGRAVTVGAVDFRPWSLELALTDVAVAAADGSAPPQLTIARIYADAELQSVLRLAPVVDAFTLEQPVLRLRHLGDGRYDVDDIRATLAAQPQDNTDTGPARLALYNLALSGGSIDYTDDSVGGKTHTVRDLALRVPFLSTLPTHREVRVEPHLSFTLNGSRFDTLATGTPFAQDGRAEATLRWQDLDLAPYLPYLPASLPVQVRAATLDLDVKLAFEQHPRPALKLTGTVQSRGVRLADRSGAELLAYESLQIDMADVRPLEQVVDLSRVELTAPVLQVARDAAGRTNLERLAASGPATRAAPAPAKPSSAPPAAAPPEATPWAVRVASVAVRGGTVRWADQAVRPAAALQATDLALELTDLALPLAKPFAFKGAFGLQDGGVRFSGEATDRKAVLNASLQALPLPLAAPYLADVLEPTVAGRITGDWGLQWEAPAPVAAGKAAPAGATGLTLTAGPLALEQFALQQGKATLASLGRLAVQDVRVQLDERTATLGKVAVVQPQLNLERGADGRWMFERWLRTSGLALADADAAPTSASTSASTPPAPASQATAAPAPTPWKVRVADFALERGNLGFADRTQLRPVALEVSGLQVNASQWANDGSKPQALQISARTAATAPASGNAATPGQINFKGTLAMQPLALQGRLDMARVPVHALDGYLASKLSAELVRADLGFQGQLALAQGAQGTTLRLAGDAAVDGLRTYSTAASTPKTEAQVGRELVSWKGLSLRGLSVATAPGTAPRVEVQETSVTDLFARVTINEAGRLNLSDIGTPPAQAQASAQAMATDTAARSTAPTRAAAAAAVAASGPVQAATPPAAATTAPDPLAPVVVSGPISLVNAQVIFSDFFIQPNYSADLTQLTGRLGAFSSQAGTGEPVLADLELRGRAEDSATIEVTGKLNPLAQPLALDITGRVRDLELPPLSPYAVRYAGHGIERGKLSMDVNYTVLPSGQLTASNRLVLNQLTFGEPVPGAPGSLPVKLAVALLADRNGVIDLDLPISGSLNDPQFRLWPIIGKVIVNLIGKALTSPFSLLASALGGGGTEMSQVAFAPGSAALTPEARDSLTKVVAALADRPALKLTVTGTANFSEEREGLQRENLRQRVLAEKRRARPADLSPVTPAEYPALLKEVYRRADMAKPRNLVGLAKELTTAEMEALLLASQPATESMAADLAQERGQAVRAFLVSQNLAADRLFVAAPKAGSTAGPWTPRAELSLKAD